MNVSAQFPGANPRNLGQPSACVFDLLPSPLLNRDRRAHAKCLWTGCGEWISPKFFINHFNSKHQSLSKSCRWSTCNFKGVTVRSFVRHVASHAADLGPNLDAEVKWYKKALQFTPFSALAAIQEPDVWKEHNTSSTVGSTDFFAPVLTETFGCREAGLFRTTTFANAGIEALAHGSSIAISRLRCLSQVLAHRGCPDTDAGFCWTSLFPTYLLPHLMPILGRSPRVEALREALLLFAPGYQDPKYTLCGDMAHILPGIRAPLQKPLQMLDDDVLVGESFVLGESHMYFVDTNTNNVWFQDRRLPHAPQMLDHPTMTLPSGQPRRFRYDDVRSLNPALVTSLWTPGPYPPGPVLPPNNSARVPLSFTGLVREGWALSSSDPPRIQSGTRSLSLVGVAGPTSLADWKVESDVRFVTYTGSNYPLPVSMIEFFRVESTPPSPDDFRVTTVASTNRAVVSSDRVQFRVIPPGTFVSGVDGIRGTVSLRYRDGSPVLATDLAPPTPVLTSESGWVSLPRAFTAGVDERWISRRG